MSNSKGFTLIELMIVVMIIAILVSIALPAYQDSVIKSRRTDAKTELMTIASQQERYIYDENTYAANLITLGYSTNVIESDGGYYDISISLGNAITYTLQADPKGIQLEDTKCGSLIINAEGTKTVTGTSTAENCW